MDAKLTAIIAAVQAACVYSQITDAVKERSEMRKLEGSDLWNFASHKERAVISGTFYELLVSRVFLISIFAITFAINAKKLYDHFI